MTASRGREPLPKWGRWGLGLLLLWALGLRLVFAGVGLDEGRFWDERYSVENVTHMLETGRLEAVSFWYPVPSYLPHTALLGAIRWLEERTGHAESMLRHDGGFTPRAYHLCRSLQAVLGTASLLLLFLLVRRQGGWKEGLLAALLLGATPNHVRLSVFFKPDVLALFAELLSVLAAVELVEDDRAGKGEGLNGRWLSRTAALGATVALAASMNLDAVVVAVPATLAVLLSRGTWRRRIVGLGVAGATSAMLFFATNPSWRLQLAHLRRIRRQYLEQSVGQGHLDVLKGEIEALVSPAFFGLVLGAVGVAGCLVLTGRVIHRSATFDAGRRRSLAVALSFPLAYSAVYAVSTTYAKENRFLLLAPWIAWGAAALLVPLGERLWSMAEGSASLGRRLKPILLGVMLALLFSVVSGPTRMVYTAKVPSTSLLFARQVRGKLDPLPWRLLWAEPIPGSEGVALVSWRDRAAVVEVSSLLDVSTRELGLGDGMVLPRSRLEGEQRDDYVELLRSYGGESERVAVEAGWLRARGPDLLAVVEPWAVAGEATVGLERVSAGEWDGALPERGSSGVLSLRIWLPREVGSPVLDIDGESLPLYSTRTDGRQDRYLSPRRIGADGAAVRLRIDGDVPLGRPPVLEIRYWSRGSLRGWEPRDSVR